MKKLIFVLPLCTLLFFNCTNDSQDDLIGSDTLPATVTYTDHVKPIIDNNCISCHSDPAVNGANVPLVTYAQVKSGIENNNLISKINGSGPGALMPFGEPKLPQISLDMIAKWEADGFIEN